MQPIVSFGRFRRFYGAFRWLVADWKGRRAFELALRAEADGRIQDAWRWMRCSNRIFRLVRDGGNAWRDGPKSLANKRRAQDFEL